jgi:hypothetical protein
MIDPLVGLFRLRFEAEIEAWSAQWAHTADPMVLWRSTDPAQLAAILPAVPGAVGVDLDGWAGVRSSPAAVVEVLQAGIDARATAFAAELLEVIEDVIHDGDAAAAMLPHLRAAVELWPGPSSDAPAEKLWRHVEATPSRRGKRWRGEALEVPHGLAWADLRPWFEEWRQGMTETEFALAFRGVTVTVRGPNGRPLALSEEAVVWLREAERLARCDLSPAFVAGEALAAMRELVAPLDSPPAFVAAVRGTLDRDGSAVAVDAAKSSERVALWALELLSVARTFAQMLTCPATDGDARELVAGLMPWDAALVHRLEELGAAADTVQNLREKRAAMVATPPRELWAFWTSPSGGGPPRWVEWLARGLWLSRWLDAAKREMRPVALHVTGMSALVTVLSGRKVDKADEGRSVLLDARGRAVASFRPRPHLATAVAADALEGLARAGVGELASIAAMRFVPWFAHAVQRRENESDPLVIVGADGMNAYGVLAAAMGMRASADANAVRGVLWAMASTMVTYPDGGEAGVLLIDYRPGGGRGNPSRLALTPGRPWLWSDVYDLPEGAKHRALAPIPLLPDFAPPFVGDPRERGALGRLYLRILAELAHLAPDIARGIGAHIPGARWAELAREEGVLRPPPLLVGLLQDRWTRDGDDGPAVLERVGTDRWHLAPAFDAERAMLEEGGKARIGASEGGKRAAKNKLKARARLADKALGKRPA